MEPEQKKSLEAIPFPEELEHLEWIRARLREALEQSADAIEKVRTNYMEARRYQAEYRHEIDPKEIFVNEMFLRDVVGAGNFEVALRQKLSKLEQSPYFARIDFHADGEVGAEICYIGRFHFDEDGQILIYDWRAPVSGMFYDYEPGRAQYRAPRGVIAGELTRKRQFQIRDGRMQYALESAVHIQDDILQRELSSTSDEKMKTIIATIQKEQNQIIRDERSGVMVIQGVAGSGKTSIALHRVAYLLYRQQARLSATNVAIISPNKVFGDFISNVLPELGEEPIIQLDLPTIAAVQLEGVVAFQPERDPVETDDGRWAERVRLKSSSDFLVRLESYLEHAALACFEPDDYVHGRFRATGEWILERYRAYGSRPVKGRIREVAADLHDRFETDNWMEDSVPSARTIEKALLRMLRIKTTLALYRDFHQENGIARQFVMPAQNTLEWVDVYPFLLAHAAFEGLRPGRAIRHLVVDEMQDYTAVQYRVLEKLFPCNMTILGDLGQCVNPHGPAGLDIFSAVFPNAKIVELNTSYRSSFEIIRFAKRILPVAKLQPVERHGEEPEIRRCADEAAMLEELQQMVGNFRGSGRNSLGVVTKTAAQARCIHESLGAESGIHLITPESESFESGVSVATVRMSKGLEFDEVVIPFADRQTYHSEFDRNLLYIACTRAMHKLTLLHSGEPTPLYRP